MDQGETDKPKIPFVKFIMFSIVHVAFLCNTYNIVIKLLYGNSVSFLCITTNTFLFFYMKIVDFSRYFSKSNATTNIDSYDIGKDTIP